MSKTSFFLKFFTFICLLLMGARLHCIVVPPQPPFEVPPPDHLIEHHLPFVLVNDSGLDDSVVFIFISGVDPLTGADVFGEIGIDGQVTFIPIGADNYSTINSTQFSVALNNLPRAYPVSNPTSTDRIVYVPFVNGGLIWYSINQPLNMPGTSSAPPPPFTYGYAQPAFNNPNDPNGNYDVLYSNFEFAFVATPTQVVGDATAVSYFGLPLYGYISTPDPLTRENTGLAQSLNEIFTNVLTLFNPVDPDAAPTGPERKQWNDLVLYKKSNPNEVLRVISPAKSISAGVIPPLEPMDPNYLDNQQKYAYSYYQEVLNFYKSNQLILSLAGTPSSGATYTGVVQADSSIRLTSTTTPFVVTIASPTPVGTVPTSTTTYLIFAGLLIASSGDPLATDDVQQLSKLFEEAIIAGLIPTTEVVSPEFLLANESSFYTFNSHLIPSTTASTGPWYDLYSKALHTLGYIYTYAFDEPLWPQVQISSQFLETFPVPTYLAIKLGPSNVPTLRTETRTIFKSSQNPSLPGEAVIFHARIKADSSFGPVTGYINYMIDGVLQKPIIVVNGKAVSEPIVLSPGRHVIRGNYSGDAAHFPSKFIRLVQYVANSTVAPPRDLKVCQTRNLCPFQRSFDNLISWKAPRVIAPMLPPVSYKIYRNASLTKPVAEVKAKPNQERYSYKDDGLTYGRTYKYFIVSVDAEGDMSQPAKIVYPRFCR